MKDRVGPHALQRGDHLIELVQIGADQLDAALELRQRERRLPGQPPDLPRAGGEQPLGQVTANKTVDAGDE